jgi:hypothetical protein
MVEVVLGCRDKDEKHIMSRGPRSMQTCSIIDPSMVVSRGSREVSTLLMQVIGVSVTNLYWEGGFFEGLS